MDKLPLEDFAQQNFFCAFSSKSIDILEAAGIRRSFSTWENI